ncbi:hypothetical protein Taro_000739, partial [Colocasia esculenta]|nr:hypothetical protein [Colocasia esculenta]
KSGHVKSECPEVQKKTQPRWNKNKQKAMVGTWSDEEDDEEEESSDAEDTHSKLGLMAIDTEEEEEEPPVAVTPLPHRRASPRPSPLPRRHRPVAERLVPVVVAKCPVVVAPSSSPPVTVAPSVRSHSATAHHPPSPTTAPSIKGSHSTQGHRSRQLNNWFDRTVVPALHAMGVAFSDPPPPPSTVGFDQVIGEQASSDVDGDDLATHHADD